MKDKNLERPRAGMVHLRLTLSSIVSFIIICLMISCAPTGGTTPVSGGNIEAFCSSLENSDFTLKLAPFVPVDLIKLYEAGKIANAAGNNADAPYRGVFGDLPENVEIEDIEQISDAREEVENWLCNTTGLLQGWQLDPDEAVVLVTKTPPECTYFSYCGFVFYKYYEKEKQRKWVWTSFNDPLNNLTIKTSGTPDGAKGNPYNQDSIIIITFNGQAGHRS